MNHHVEESHPPGAPALDYQVGKKESSVAFEPGNASAVGGNSQGSPCLCVLLVFLLSRFLDRKQIGLSISRRRAEAGFLEYQRICDPTPLPCKQERGPHSSASRSSATHTPATGMTSVQHRIYRTPQGAQ